MKKIIISLLLTTFLFSQRVNLKYIKTDVDNYPRTVIAAQVSDDNNEPIKDLQQNNFTINVDGKSFSLQQVTTYQKSFIGMNITLALDLSGSMKGEPLESMKKAIYQFIDEMRAIDKLSIVGFDNSARIICDFSSNKEYLKQQVSNLTTSGNQTALYYGIYKGLSTLIDNKEKAGKILIVVSDGKDENDATSYTLDDDIKRAQDNGIPVFTIGYSKIGNQYFQVLEKLSEQTGGSFYESPTSEDLSKQYKKLYEKILNIYLLSGLSPVDGDGMEHVFAVTVDYNNSRASASKKEIIPAGVKGNTETETKSKDTDYTFIIIIAVILLVIAAGAFVYFKMKKKKKNSNATSDDEDKSGDYPFKSGNDQNIKDVPTVIYEYPNTVNNSPTISNNYAPNTLMMKITKGVWAGQIKEIKTKTIIGRKEGNIIIPDSMISSKHAEIDFVNKNFIINDLGSTNGVYINGQRVLQAIIKNGDTFKFGQTEGVFEIIEDQKTIIDGKSNSNNFEPSKTMIIDNK